MESVGKKDDGKKMLSAVMFVKLVSCYTTVTRIILVTCGRPDRIATKKRYNCNATVPLSVQLLISRLVIWNQIFIFEKLRILNLVLLVVHSTIII